MSDTPGPGHNSGDILQKSTQTELKSIMERIENQLDERREINESIKEIKAEAKGRGFDPPTIMKLIAIRAKDRAKRQEEVAMLQLYAQAIGLDENLV